MKVGIVTCKAWAELSPDDRCILAELAQRSIHAEVVIWNDPKVNWVSFDLLIIRSVWDYHLIPDEFLEWLGHLESEGVNTLNPIEVIRANMHKFYLKWLEETGVKITPTLFVNPQHGIDPDFLDRLGWDKAVLKPAVSASAYLTQVIDRNNVQTVLEEIQEKYPARDWLVQRFVPEIQSFGELSIMFFNRQYSHTVLKTAQKDEFRVQSEYGGSTSKYKLPEAIVKDASAILDRFEGDILYTRVDGVMVDNEFVLMEIELIEPYLFLGHHPGACSRLVDEAINLTRGKKS